MSQATQCCKMNPQPPKPCDNGLSGYGTLSAIRTVRFFQQSILLDFGPSLLVSILNPRGENGAALRQVVDILTSVKCQQSRQKPSIKTGIMCLVLCVPCPSNNGAPGMSCALDVLVLSCSSQSP